MFKKCPKGHTEIDVVDFKDTGINYVLCHVCEKAYYPKDYENKLKKTGKHVKLKKEIPYYLFKRIGTGEKFGAKARTAEEARNIINRRTFAPKYKLKLIKKSKLKVGYV